MFLSGTYQATFPQSGLRLPTPYLLRYKRQATDTPSPAVRASRQPTGRKQQQRGTVRSNGVSRGKLRSMALGPNYDGVRFDHCALQSQLRMSTSWGRARNQSHLIAPIHIRALASGIDCRRPQVTKPWQIWEPTTISTAAGRSVLPCLLRSTFSQLFFIFLAAAHSALPLRQTSGLKRNLIGVRPPTPYLLDD